MTKSHTPGPWQHWYSDGCWNVGQDSSTESLFTGKQENQINGNCEPDARLSSAAPDLLEALEALVEYVDEMHRIGHIQRPVQSSNAVAAIAKARGGK